jgi:hypothetical protein
MGDSEVSEDFYIVLWIVAKLLVLRHSLLVVYWSHECDKLSGYDPVEVAVLYLLIILILTGIEVFKAVPS